MASITKRGKNSYRLTVSCGYDSHGQKLFKQKTITLDSSLTPKQTEKELHRQAALFEKEVQDGTFLDGGKITFAEFTESWIKDYAEKQLQPKTLSRYKDMLNARIIPALGHIKLQKLQPNHLLQFYNNLGEKGVRLDIKYSVKPELNEIIKAKGIRPVDLIKASGVASETIRRVKAGCSITQKTASALSSALEVKIDQLFEKAESGELSGQSIRHHHRLISSILTSAVQWQYILSNPAARIKPPKVEKNEALHFEEDTTEKLLNLLENEPLKYKIMIYLALYSGSRLGEIAGLEWSDIDFVHNLIRICRSSQYIPGTGTITKKPKNVSSERVIAMPQLVMDLLRQYKLWQNEERLKCGDRWQDHDRLFTQWNGKPIFPSTPTIWFKDFRRKHNLPDVKFHGLRHTNASLLISQGVDIQTVAKRLGHTKATTTTSVYSHFLKRPDREAAEILQNLFQNNNRSMTQKG